MRAGRIIEVVAFVETWAPGRDDTPDNDEVGAK